MALIDARKCPWAGVDNLPYARDWVAGRKIAVQRLVEGEGHKSMFTFL